MSLPNFDATAHHIGLAEDGGTLKGYLLTGGYDVRGQNFGNPTDFGGDRDLVSAPRLSRWTQDDFTGGIYRENWGKDPAAFSSSENILPMPTDRSVRSVPPLFHLAGTGGTTDVAERVRRVFSAGGYVFACHAETALFPGWVDRYDLSDASVTRYTNTGGILDGWIDFQYDAGEQVLYILHNTRIERKTMPGFGDGVPHYYDFPVSITDDSTNPSSLEISRGVILFGVGNRLYRVAVPVNGGTPATNDWVLVDRLPGPWVDSCSFGGLTYILCGGADQPTSIVSYDGVAMNPITDLPYNFEGRCITTYAGRVYVGGAGRDVSGSDQYAELFEITGSSVRLVKSWAVEKATGVAASATSIEGLVVHQGLLFFGINVQGLVAYDIVTDAFYGGPMVFDTTSDEQWGKATSARGTIYIWANTTLSGHRGIYRIATAGDNISSPTNYAVVTTSEFAPEPDRAKRFSLLRVLSRRVAAAAEYSVDGGATWTALAFASSSTRGDLITSTFDLSALGVTDSIRFRFSMAFTDATTVAELIAFTVAFAFLDTGKLTWQLTVNGAASVEQANGVGTIDQDTGLLLSTLRGYWENQTRLDYRDVDGTSYKAQLVDFRQSQPIITENFTASGGSAGREAFYSLTLIEV